jgi:hypothetical protein
LFLPTEHEIYGNATVSENEFDDGVRIHFPVYQKSSVYRVKRYNGARVWWWEGTPRVSIPTDFTNVNIDGSAGAESVLNVMGGVAPAFCVA